MSVLSLKKNTTQQWLSYFQNARKYQTYFMTDPLTKFGFGIW